MYKNVYVNEWVEQMAKMTQPDSIVWIDGSEEERERLTKQAVSTGEMMELNSEKLPGCLYHRTAENDVARVEHLTFICTSRKEDAGPTNNWMEKSAAYAKLGTLFAGCMKGRTMYVIPYIMGPAFSEFSKVGIEITDSIYVVLNMRIMTRMGKVAMDMLGDSPNFVKGLHSKGELDPEKRFICHFPEDNAIWSIGSGYGGNVLLGKKCFALRIASWLGRKEGWMAEHMLILGVEDPSGKIQYVSAAFPSACGKTNLAMLIPPEKYREKGYKVWTVGDDIAWLRIGPDGRLWAVNPESGFFGVAPGTSMKSNPNALLTCQKNTIFTNVALTPEKTVWWEGMGVPAPAHAIDWKGNEWTPDMGTKAAHPNSRFTAPANQCPCISKEWENPAGVPITAMIFGGRRAKVAPLVYQSFSWEHGVFVGATMASETTAAATGAVGVVRRDPMAMLPFCGYNMGEYFQHWLEMGKKIPNPPKIFNVNWFRVDEEGHFIWPGFGDNLRVLLWILARCNNEVDAVESPIGYLPKPEDIDLEGTEITQDVLKGLLSIDKEAWTQEVEDQKTHLERFEKLPKELWEQYNALAARIAKM
ncbi:MAG: phosphoenolpyruvate carboxykinase (GTP) [Clostridiales bacterium]|nr:phosphoenolpyruvate carboxykinase (GTP) [Clostridiales bacterium]PWM23408.1 MAG: phosphoenolpyruvate carboxykinase (GTP) [Clostridiales bacterium]